MEREPRFISVDRRRNMLSRALLQAFPTEHIGDTSPLEKTEALAREGYGIVLVYNHFSKSDHIRAIATALQSVTTITQKRLGSPVALHQNKLHLRALRRLARAELMPIVTDDTKKQAKEKKVKMPQDPEERRREYQRYIATARNILTDGGTILVAPQAGRRAVLGEPPAGQPVRQLLSGYDNNKVLFLFAGLGIPDETNYGGESVRGLNVRTHFTVQFGGPLTRSELLERCGGDEAKIDTTIFDELRAVVPVVYNEKPSAT